MRSFQLFAFLLLSEIVFCQVPAKPAVKSATAQKSLSISNTTMKKPDAKTMFSFSSSWLRKDMDLSKVILGNNWLPDGLTGFLFQDVHAFPLYTQLMQEALFLYPDLSEGELAGEYITPIDRGQLWNAESLRRDNVTVINVYEPFQTKRLGWRIEKWPDGAISLFNLRYGAYLGLRANGSEVSAELIDSARATDPMRIKFLLYGLGKLVQRPLSFYHPATKTFLGLEKNNAFNDWTTDASNAQSRQIQKLPVKFKGYAWPTAFDFGQEDRHTLRFFAPGESMDKDGDGHKSQEAGGDDCDDNDPNRFPGNVEKMDSTGHDEDCICNYELVDRDHDGHYDIRSFNVCSDGTIVRGDDCDDNNPAIIPGAVIYISETEAEVCGRGKIKAEAGTKFMKQANRLATSIPKY